MSPTPNELAADDVIGGYELLRRVGKGGMAEVWVARRANSRTSKYVAIKVIAPHLAGQDRYSRMFRAEAELAAMLNHSNIVQVFDEGEDQGISFLVMEWVDGINLVRLREALKFVDDDGLRWSVIAHVVGQLLHALSYAHNVTTTEGHELGIVHRDVSPQNVLVSNSGDIKLTDFGIAHTVIEESSHLHVKGKLRYMSPEQLAGKTKEPTIDLYAVGAILHELLEGMKFRGDFEDERVMHSQVLAGIVPPLTRPCPPELEALRLALLEPDESRRVPTADAALSLLAEFRGYRDMRIELSKICGSLTGVARPRTGPGVGRRRSSATPAPVAPSSSAPGAGTEFLPAPYGSDQSARPEATTLLSDAEPPSHAGPVGNTLYMQAGGLPAEVAARYGHSAAASSTAGEEPTATSASSRSQTSTGEWIAGAEGDGTSTRFVARRGRPSWGVLLGLTAVFLLGGVGTAWLLVRGLDDETDEPSMAIALPAKAEPGAEAEPDPEAPLEQPEIPATRAKPEPVEPAPEDAVEPVARPEPEPTPEAAAEDPEPAEEAEDAEQPAPRAESPRTKRRPKPEPEVYGAPVVVYVQLDGIPEAWLQVGGKTIQAGPGRNAVIKSGRWTVRWRPSIADPWRSIGKRNFAEGKDWVVKIGASGPKVTAFQR